jgi:hypothetical protein
MRRDLEKRAQDAILNSIFEDYKKKKEAWLNDPPIKKAMFLQAFFSTKNALLIAAIIIMTGFVSLFLLAASGLGFVAGALGGLLLLALAEVVFMVSSLKDEKLHARVVAEMLRPRIDFNPDVIKDAELREKVDKALEYWSLIDDEMQKIPGGIINRDSAYAVTHQEATNWLQAVYNLAKHVDKLRLNKVVQQDLKKLPGAIKAYEAELKMAAAPEVQEQLQRTIADKKRQLQTLQTLENNVAKATYQLDSTISSLGTIYSQLLLVGSKDQSGGRMNRLQAEISEQVRELQDLTEAMDEVYQSSS